MLLCFGFVDKTELQTHQVRALAVTELCSCSIQVLSFSHSALHVSRLGVGKRLEGTKPGPKLTKGLSYTIASHPVPSHPVSYDVILHNKSSRKGQEGGTCVVMVSFQVTIVNTEAFVSQMWLDNCLLMRSSEKCLFFILCSRVHLLLHFILIHEFSCLLSLFSSFKSKREWVCSQSVLGHPVFRDLEIL